MTRITILIGCALALTAMACGGGGGSEGTATPEAVSPSPEAVDPAEFVQQYIDTFNRGDLDGVMEAWADDGVIRFSYECVTPGPAEGLQALLGDCIGKEAIRNLSEYHINQNNLNLTVTDTQVSGDSVTVMFEIRSEQVTAAELDRLPFSSTFLVRDGKIAEQGAGPPPEAVDQQTAAFVGYLLRESIRFDLGPGRDGDQTPASAFLYPLGERTQVTVGIQPGPAGVRQPIRIHEGSCSELGDLVAPLQDVAGGQSATMIDIPFDALQEAGHAIVVSQSEAEIDVYVACGDIPAAVAD